MNGQAVHVEDEGSSLLAVLRERLRLTSVKDGCSPQGQCGCCTVLVDGQPRVSCVTPARRVAGRSITTVEGLSDAAQWADAFCAAGASQCGFCTPGIIVRLHAARAKHAELSASSIDSALLAHQCRCTGWRTIYEAAHQVGAAPATRDLAAAARRAEIEGRVSQRVDAGVALGRGGFADDSPPSNALVAVSDGHGGWATGETVDEARAAAGKVQGRRTTAAARPPIDIPLGDWAVVLQTSWIEPGYLETDASWCEPGGEPASPLANGGAFGGKASSPVAAVARELADRHGRAVRVLMSREDSVRFGAKRPPLAAGLRADGTGVVHVARTHGIVERIRSVAPHFDVVEVDVAGPPTSIALRGAGSVEAAVLLAALRGHARDIALPGCGTASATIDGGGIDVAVECGEVLDEVMLRSYCIGAAHMAYSWVTSEQLTVDGDGLVHDLTMRSFGVLRAVDTPDIRITLVPSDAPPVNGSDSVFAAVAAATWIARGLPPRWPTLNA